MLFYHINGCELAVSSPCYAEEPQVHTEAKYLKWNKTFILNVLREELMLAMAHDSDEFQVVVVLQELI